MKMPKTTILVLVYVIYLFGFGYLCGQVNGGEINQVILPNLKYEKKEGSEGKPSKKWNYALPFFAQNVIDMGYELPRPYGLQILLVGMNQQLYLDNLEVGFNGGDKYDINFVSFPGARARNYTPQVKLDAWVFPFLNVFGFIGYIDGDSTVKFQISGDQVLLNQGIDCNNPKNFFERRLCRALKGKSPVFRVDSNFRGYNVGLGAVLATGWRDYFFTLPITYSYSFVDITDSRIETINLTPRVGKVIDLRTRGKLAVFVGATYQDATVDVTGTVKVPGTDVDIDYKIYQKNKDKWNGLVGYNWDFSKTWSWYLEFGFLGTRNNVITGIGYRF